MNQILDILLPAKIDNTIRGEKITFYAFALWGSSQLLFALVQLLAVIRYRSLIPFLWLMIVLEIFLRELVGAMKPVTFAHTPPSAIGNVVMLLVATLMLALALWSAYRQGQAHVKP